MKRLASLIIALLLIASAILCTGCKDRDAEPPPSPVNLLNENGEAIYRIVYAEGINNDTKEKIIAFKNDLDELEGAEFALTSDKFAEGEGAGSVTNVCEILVGATNRPESAQAREGLTVNDYVIRVVGAKIVIAGGSDLMTARAMDAFLAMIDLENGDALKTNTDIKEEIERGSYLVALTNQRKWRLEVYDISDGKLDDSSLVWYCKTPYRNIAGAKLRRSEKHGDVALFVSGNRYGCMVSYPEGKVVWSTEAAASNPHSIELLPNGVVAIASSDGGEVRFFTTEDRTSKAPKAKTQLYDAHGVLWDEEREVLWAIGGNSLAAYRVSLNNDGSVTVTEDKELSATIPTGGAHDLAPVYGDKNALWITTGAYVYRYNKTEKTFTVDYNGNQVINCSGVKGIGNFQDGSTVFIYPDGAYQSWTSKSMYLWKNGTEEKITVTSEDGDFYKVRVWDTRYQ